MCILYLWFLTSKQRNTPTHFHIFQESRKSLESSLASLNNFRGLVNNSFITLLLASSRPALEQACHKRPQVQLPPIAPTILTCPPCSCLPSKASRGNSRRKAQRYASWRLPSGQYHLSLRWICGQEPRRRCK